jgi:hypothetical protein
VTYFCNPRYRQIDSKFEVSLGYIGRPCLKTKQQKNNKQIKNTNDINTVLFLVESWRLGSVLTHGHENLE